MLNEPRVKYTRKSKAEVTHECRRKRNIGNLPPVFPNGWFAIVDSNDVAKKQVKHIAALGKIKYKCLKNVFFVPHINKIMINKILINNNK